MNFRNLMTNKNPIFFMSLIILISISAKSQEPKDSFLDNTKVVGQKVAQEAEEKINDLKESLNKTPQRRGEKDLSLTASYSLLDTWTLGKFGIAASFQNPTHSWDVDFQHGSLGLNFIADIGSLSEDRLHVFKRSYAARNSFNWYYGFFISRFRLHLGNSVMDSVTQGSYPNVDLLEVQMLGPTLGFGNRWQRRSGVSFGIDWLQVNIPLFTIKEHSPFFKSDASSDDKDAVRDSLRYFKYFPTLSVGKLYFGYSF